MDLLEYQGKQLFQKHGVTTMLGAAERVVDLAR
jgi:succinyl-CoA synthetase beta subunit